MNREQKLEFIKEHHPELYASLTEHVNEFVNDVWNADTNTIDMYNNWVAFYCGGLKDIDLMDKLLI